MKADEDGSGCEGRSKTREPKRENSGNESASSREELQELMATTSVDRVWKSLEMVQEKWEMEAVAAGGQEEI